MWINKPNNHHSVFGGEAKQNEFEVDGSISDDDGEDGNNNEDRFVGLVSYTEEEAEYSTHPGRNASRGSTVDDLSDLLALYNEVLELTNAPLDSPLVQGNRNESAATNVEDSLAVVRSVARQRNRRWPLGVFNKSTLASN